MQPETQLNQSKPTSSIVDVHGIKKKIKTLWMKKTQLNSESQIFFSFSRIYRMGSSDELETFRAELLKRPLVVQPIVMAGSGFQSINCFFSVQRGRQLLLIANVSTIPTGEELKKNLTIYYCLMWIFIIKETINRD